MFSCKNQPSGSKLYCEKSTRDLLGIYYHTFTAQNILTGEFHECNTEFLFSPVLWALDGGIFSGRVSPLPSAARWTRISQLITKSDAGFFLFELYSKSLIIWHLACSKFKTLSFVPWKCVLQASGSAALQPAQCHCPLCLTGKFDLCCGCALWLCLASRCHSDSNWN